MAFLLNLWAQGRYNCVQEQEPPVLAHSGLASLLSLFQGQAGGPAIYLESRAGHLLGESFPYHFSWTQTHRLWWLWGVDGWDSFSFVMLHSANRGHWRDGATSIAPKKKRGTISTGLPAAERLRSLPGWVVGFGSLGWCLLFVTPRSSCHALVFLPPQLGPSGSLSWLDS